MATMHELAVVTAENEEFTAPPSVESQAIELSTLTSLPPTAPPSDLEQTLHENTISTRNEISHAPVDGGLGAWSFVG